MICRVQISPEYGSVNINGLIRRIIFSLKDRRQLIFIADDQKSRIRLIKACLHCYKRIGHKHLGCFIDHDQIKSRERIFTFITVI